MGFYQILTQRSGIQIILQTIKDFGPISKKELQERTGLSAGHISQVTRKFLEEGRIVICETEMTGGRNRELIDINRSDNYFVGIDLNNMRVRAVVVDMKGRELYEQRRAWKVSEKEYVLETIYQLLDEIITKYHDKKILGIGFAVQGIVDAANGISVRIDKIQNWKDVHLKELIEERYQIRTMIAHDPDCLMKCECNFGALKSTNVTDAVLVHYHYGIGIGLSILINGQIYIGHKGMAGEIGYTIMNVDENGRPDMLGFYGDKKTDDVDMKVLADYIGRSVAMVNSIYDPEVIVLCIIEDDYRDEIVKCIEHYLSDYSCDNDVTLTMSHLNRNAKALGAALISVDEEINSIA